MHASLVVEEVHCVYRKFKENTCIVIYLKALLPTTILSAPCTLRALCTSSLYDMVLARNWVSIQATAIKLGILFLRRTPSVNSQKFGTQFDNYDFMGLGWPKFSENTLMSHVSLELDGFNKNLPCCNCASILLLFIQKLIF